MHRPPRDRGRGRTAPARYARRVIPDTFSPGPLEQDLEAAWAHAFSSLAALWNEEHMRHLFRLPRGATVDDHRRADGAVTPGKSSTTPRYLHHRRGGIRTRRPSFPTRRSLGPGRDKPRFDAAGRARHDRGDDRAANAAWRPGQAFVASIKAMHFLIRALQDAAYMVLREIVTERRAVPRARRGPPARARCRSSTPARTRAPTERPTRHEATSQ
jgi:hypothetical protein